MAGVAQPPRLYTPPPIDDFESVYRFSFDQFIAYQLWAPEVFRVWLGAAAVPTLTGMAVQ